LQQRLWRVGTPDHTSKEFRFGNLQKQYGLWWRYLNEMGESNLNFTIGQSVESNNWYYAQPELWTTPQSAPNFTDHTQTNFVTWSPVWNVIFNLTNLPPTNVLCTVALAGCNGCYFYPYINGVNVTPNIANFSNPSQGVFTLSVLVPENRFRSWHQHFLHPHPAARHCQHLYHNQPSRRISRSGGGRNHLRLFADGNGSASDHRQSAIRAGRIDSDCNFRLRN
jgi:hypothetical protein